MKYFLRFLQVSFYIISGIFIIAALGSLPNDLLHLLVLFLAGAFIIFIQMVERNFKLFWLFFALKTLCVISCIYIIGLLDII